MAGLTHAQQLAFAREISEILNNNAADLVAAGFDPALKVVQIQTEAQAAELAEANQQQAQAVAKQATRDAVEAMQTAYKTASASVEIVTGLFGKEHTMVQEIKKVRGEMNRPRREE